MLLLIEPTLGRPDFCAAGALTSERRKPSALGAGYAAERGPMSRTHARTHETGGRELSHARPNVA